jgi:hypothetical protein
MHRILRFARKNVGRVVGTVVGGPALGAIVGGGAEAMIDVSEAAPPVDTIEGALYGFVLAAIALYKQYRAYQKKQDTL